ncbi:MAG TPA: class I SAM-dependent methyltransferase [Myxococcales bacterium]|jgi:2-polyprenyl-3-methyl-5-hydroxy-6-metoxy-1,4-benzoquinol methylase|nr:class I SAM-dependent methyltransferase [Myxococcales bacterium]
MSDAAQLKQEAEFFDRWAEESIKKLQPIDPRIVDRYRSPGKWYPKEYCITLLGDLRGKRILDVGCGEGEDAILLAKLGAIVTGFDVSPGAISVAKRRAEIDGVSDRVSFICAPLAEAQLPQGSFDVIWFDNILHHVLDELDFVMRKILASAKPGADLICIEPVNLNKTLRKIRFLVPVHTEVTPGERPLEKHDLAVIDNLVPVRRRHFLFLGRLIRFILGGYRYESAAFFQRLLADLVVASDRVLLSLPRVEHLGGLAVMHGKIGPGPLDSR